MPFLVKQITGFVQMKLYKYHYTKGTFKRGIPFQHPLWEIQVNLPIKGAGSLHGAYKRGSATRRQAKVRGFR